MVSPIPRVIQLRLGTKFFGQADQNPFGTADVAEAVRVLVLHHLTDKRRTPRTKPSNGLVDVAHSEHCP